MKEGYEIETNMENFLKTQLLLGDIAFPNGLLFLKIVTKWREFQKSGLNINFN